jgi:hypothetical protein
VASVVVVLAMLSGCTTPEPEAMPTPTESATPTPAPQEEDEVDGPFATVSIAGVDVDGLNFTVGGFVGGVSEEGGTCTYALTSGVTGNTVTVVTTGVANGATTSCGSSKVAMSELSKGPWTVELEYASPTAEVTSPPLEVEVP